MAEQSVEYWKQRAKAAEDALNSTGDKPPPGWLERTTGAIKDKTGKAWEATKEGTGKAWEATKDAVDPLASKAGAAIGKGVDAAAGKVSDLETLFLDNVLPPTNSMTGSGAPGMNGGQPHPGGLGAPAAPEMYGPPDPMEQAMPPHMRQFYGSEGNWGQPPEPPAKDPGIMNEALRAAEEAYNNTLRRFGGGGQQRPAGPMPPQFPGGATAPAPGVRLPGR